MHSVNLPDGSLVQYDSTANANGDTNEEDRPRAWFFAKDVPGEPGKKKYEGLDETWKLLKETLESETFDVVLGFSQGQCPFRHSRHCGTADRTFFKLKLQNSASYSLRQVLA